MQKLKVVPSRLEQVKNVVWLKRELRYEVGRLKNLFLTELGGVILIWGTRQVGSFTWRAVTKGSLK